MSNVPFQPLVVLEKRPILGKRETGVRIVFHKVQPLLSVELEEGEIDEQEKIREPTKIVDKRKMNQANRQQILDRLRQNSIVKTTEEIIKETVTPIESTGPIKTAKRLVIKVKSKPQTEEISEFEVKKQKMVSEVEKDLERDLEKDLERDLERDLEKDIGKIELNPSVIEKELSEDTDLEQLEKIIKESVTEESVVILEKEKPKRGRKVKGALPNVVEEPVDLTTATIRSQKVLDRLPKERERVVIRAPTFYMNNRKIFVQKLTELFKPYEQELLDQNDSNTCGKRLDFSEFDLLTHQKIVRDYLNLYTPYRGLLLYHGLGSGKTCTSIAIAEGMKSNKRVFILTPASLKMNFFTEMKKCGDHIYKKNQYWEFVSIDGKPEYVGILSRALSLSSEYIRKYNGAWLVNVQKESNFSDLSTDEQSSLDNQLNEMIRSKYTDINYNGLNMRRMEMLTGGFTHNPFDNAVIVVDEAHNLVSRIVNKIKQPKSIAYLLYDYLMNATNVKIVLLSGTPIINYPNEISVLYNILRGYIKSWTIPLSWEKKEKLNTDTIQQMLDDNNLKTFDYVDFADNKLTITRNPFGFINTKKRGALKGVTRKRVLGGGKKQNKNNNKKTKKHQPKQTSPFNMMAALIQPYEKEDIAVDEDVGRIVEQNPYEGGQKHVKQVGGASEAFDRYNGVLLDETGNISDNEFISSVIRILKNPKNDITVSDGGIILNKYKALPDDSQAFLNMFVDTDSGDAKNINLFQRRILGLTSYFRSAQEQLLPRFVLSPTGDIYHVERIEMSGHQFGQYEKIRKIEAEREKTNKKQKFKSGPSNELFTISSTYRIFSRAACNFVFPTEIERPIPNTSSNKDLTENVFDLEKKEPLEELIDETESEISDADNSRYETRIVKAMEDLNVRREDTNESIYLSKEVLPMFSPKFAKVLENITNPENIGLHLLYSHFRTIEGIGILRLILLANGYAEFKLQKIDDEWNLIEPESDAGKPKFVLYTGTETIEEKEIIRNVYNGAWENVPANVVTRLQTIAANNDYGEIIKLFMITSSGAEGINLRNTRFVHIIEPYWHMVRVEQVVGRARRICSHESLPEELRTVKVFLYVSVFSQLQKTDEKNIEIRIRDVSKLDKNTPVTTDENLYEIASIKQRINNQILNAVKETAIDCNIYSAVAAKKQKSTDEPMVCYGFGKIESNAFSSYPSIEIDQGEKTGLDVKLLKWRAIKITVEGVDYALNENTNEIYNFESYQRAIRLGTEPILEGRLIVDRGMMRIEKV